VIGEEIIASKYIQDFHYDIEVS